jgi:hypothetical protein
VSSDPFIVSALVDFPDDCRRIAFTPGLVDNLIERLEWMGARRVYWNFYQEEIAEFFMLQNPFARQTKENLGDPLAAGCRAAHKRGMEFYATIKPYETGLSATQPAAGPEALANPGLPSIGGVHIVDSWVMARPELRIKGRSAEIPDGLESVPIRRIQLRQKDMEQVRIRPENIEIWTSRDNAGYKKIDVSFDVRESVEICPRDVVDMDGGAMTKKGESVRALDLTGLDLLDPFIAITTNFDDGRGTFVNTALEMVRAFGPENETVPIVVASHSAVWRPGRDLRTDDLQYDNGVGDIAIRLDVANSRPVSADWGGGAPTSDGVIALARGRNEYLSGAMCEAYPEVREHWLDWVGQCIAAGVDGVDVRISNHSSWSNTPSMYGFNEPVAEEYERRYGTNPDTEYYDPELLGGLRGEFFDLFLRAAKTRLSAAGKRLSVHAEMESFRPDACQSRWRTRPGNIDFNWRGWLRSGLADEATLLARGWNVDRILDDALVQEMLREAADAGVPAHLSKQVGHNEEMPDQDKLEYAYRHGGLAGYCLYETAAMYDRDQPVSPDGTLSFQPGLLESVRRRVESLGLLAAGGEQT